MKRLIALSIALAASLALQAQEKIAVYLSPDATSPQIGALDSLSLAVPAEWPAAQEAAEGWRPIYYRGLFTVFVHNNDIAKDLSAKAGANYYLQASKNAPVLAIATDKDKSEILSVDTWYCQLELETIVLAYIQETSVEASSIVQSLAKDTPATNPQPTTAGPQSASSIKEMEGKLLPVGLLEKKKAEGLAFKLQDRTGTTLAFLDLSRLPERIQAESLAGQIVRVSGELRDSSSGSAIILTANTLKKAN